MWAVRVPGIPMPKGSMRAIVRNGKALMIPDTRHRKEFEAWRSAVKAGGTLIAHRLPDGPLDEPVSIQIVFTLPVPDGDPGRPWPWKKPGRQAGGGDLDKLVRVVLDELTTAGVMRDDSRVVHLTAIKAYPHSPAADVLPEPGAIIRVTSITPITEGDTLP